MQLKLTGRADIANRACIHLRESGSLYTNFGDTDMTALVAMVDRAPVHRGFRGRIGPSILLTGTNSNGGGRSALFRVTASDPRSVLASGFRLM